VCCSRTCGVLGRAYVGVVYGAKTINIVNCVLFCVSLIIKNLTTYCIVFDVVVFRYTPTHMYISCKVIIFKKYIALKNVCMSYL